MPPLLIAGLALAFAAGGCSKRSSPSRHDLLNGTVESVRADTGQLTVRVLGARTEQNEPERVSCLLTSDAEVYVNDKFTGPEAISIGDTVELIGYPDPSPRAERFLVCLALITRNEPLPPEPDLSPPNTQPATQP